MKQPKPPPLMCLYLPVIAHSRAPGGGIQPPFRQDTFRSGYTFDRKLHPPPPKGPWWFVALVVQRFWWEHDQGTRACSGPTATRLGIGGGRNEIALFGNMAVSGQETLDIFQPDARANTGNQIVKFIPLIRMQAGNLPGRQCFDLDSFQSHLVDAKTSIHLCHAAV